MAFILILAGIVIGDVVCALIVKKIKKDDSFYMNAAASAFNLLAGAIMHEYAKIQMYVVDGYTWEGFLTEHESFVYTMNYMGLVIGLMGFIGLFLACFDAIRSAKGCGTTASKPSDNEYTESLKVRGIDSEKARIEERTAKELTVEKPALGHFKTCPKCGRKQQADRRYCIDCGLDFFDN